jgi:hypothetical protein
MGTHEKKNNDWLTRLLAGAHLGGGARRYLALLIVGVAWLSGPLPVAAQESLCAEVKIEIKQELTLERQAFEAHMRINNGLSHITLENVTVTVNFTDENGNPVEASSDPNNTTADFFIRLDSTQNVANLQMQANQLDFTGTVNPSTSADLYWLIIPVPGASEGLPEGKLYYVGATLTYTIGGETHVTEVTPDYIYVKPMPQLYLDYFLPNEVYGDDAFTADTEPPVPFSLGLRISNQGYGPARRLKIESAEVEIVDNAQGLLVDFLTQGTEVNGQGVTPSLLADFGTIEADASGVARWIMTCSLSGRFVDFQADFSHADELGGELTSLIEEVNTHSLLRDVLVDLHGQDDIRDFLATKSTAEADREVYVVYESDNTEAPVPDRSEIAVLTPSGGLPGAYTLSFETPDTSDDFVYVRKPVPAALGTPDIWPWPVSAVRADGKSIKAENIWISKIRKENPADGWDYFVNLFDAADALQVYTLFFEATEASPPALDVIPDQAGVEGQELLFMVEASDPDGTLPALSVAPLPSGAIFTDHGDGTGTFAWTPAVGQAGIYYLTVEASDGELTASQPVTITIDLLLTYTITATVGTNGSITPAGAVVVMPGADQAFAITPDEGYHVADVLVDGTSVGAVSSYTFHNVTDDHTIEAVFALTIPEVVTISGRVWTSDGFSGLPDVALNGFPGSPTTDDLGYYQADVATGWSGTVTPQKLDYSFAPVFRSYSSLMLDQDQQDYTGTAPSHTLTVVLAGDGSGVVSGDGGIDCGTVCTATVEKYTQVSLSVMPDAGSVFVSADGAECSQDGTCVLTIVEETVVTVMFASDATPTPTPTPVISPTPGEPIPEPTTVVLVVLGLLGLLGLNLRRKR